MQDLTERHHKVNVFNLRRDDSHNPAAAVDLQKDLSAHFPKLNLIQTSEVADQNDILRILRSVAWGTSVIALFMGFVIILNTLLTSITERKKEIEIFSSLGWPQRQILLMIVYEGSL
jgi:putative ABC transport system permease protein